MTSTGIMQMLRIGRCTNSATIVNGFHTSSATYLNQYWRTKKGLTTNPNTTGPLITLPDFSYKDNRPTPYGSNQLKRIKTHQEYAKKVIKLVAEVDYAVEKHAKRIKEEEVKKKQILDSKLKPKGKILLTEE
ncbi:mitochondrial ribosomal protein L52 [Calliopsis andreniformis]|uniref:mitochondrial ribosomal protein L52 n=1 Tax=Calliopsis andreniformis TaxID=337506 RepID=UPI003FCD65D6